jgi:two-component system, OmpR family, response regulator
MAVEAHHPGAGCRPRLTPPKAAALGLAVWVVPEEGTSPELLARAAELVLARALETAPEAEVHWPAAGAPMSGTAAQPPLASPAETPDDGGTRLPPSAGPVSRMAVDLAAETVLLDGRPVPLTGVEYKVLRYLVTHLSRTVGREELQEFLDSFETPGASARSIDVYVGRIRRKLRNARHAVATVRGGGYQFIPGSCATVRGPAEYCI